MIKFKYGKSIIGALLLALTVTYMPVASAIKLVINAGNNNEEQGPYHWKQYQGKIPRNAIIGGNEGDQVVYICQAAHRGNVHPGKMLNGGGGGTCFISYGGREIPRQDFKVLVGKNLDWRNADRRMPHNAVVGGYENGGPLYVCHARFGHRGVIPGKVVAGACNIPYRGQEIPLYNYQVLVSY